MADMDEKLDDIEDIFGLGLSRILTSSKRTLDEDVFEALKIIFSVRDEDLNLEGIKSDKSSDDIKVSAQAPYKAMARMLVMLSERIPVTDEDAS
jgi:hypothetical protein